METRRKELVSLATVGQSNEMSQADPHGGAAAVVCVI